MTDTKRMRELLAEYTQATPRIGHLITLEIPAVLDENIALKAEVARLRKYEQVALDMAEKGMGIVRIAPEDMLREPNNGWIPVGERLPDDGDAFLAIWMQDDDYSIDELRRDGDDYWNMNSNNMCGLMFTHWMDKPPAPEGD